MSVDLARTPVFNRTHFRIVSAAATTWIGPIPSNVSHVRIYTGGSLVFAGVAADTATEVATTGSTTGVPIPSGQQMDVQVPRSRRYVGVRTQVGSADVYVTELGEPST